MNAEFHTTRTELANEFAEAGRELLAYMGTDAALAAIPNTDQYVVAGTLQMIAKVLPAVPPVSAAEQPSVLMDERVAFEEWARRTHRRPGTSFDRAHNGTYKDNRIAAKWAAWQACVTAHLARQSPAPEKAKPAELTPLDYRAQGREEALAIILAESAEDPFSDYTGWAKSGAPDDEGGAYWKEDELRKLLHIGDKKHDAYDRAEAAYWQALGEKDEAKRELLFVQQAPFYEPLHDFLAKHEAWDLMGDLKRAAPVAQEVEPGSAPAAADEVRNQALEEAARAIQSMGDLNPPISFGIRCAEAIRALKTTASAATSEEGGVA